MWTLFMSKNISLTRFGIVNLVNISIQMNLKAAKESATKGNQY